MTGETLPQTAMTLPKFVDALYQGAPGRGFVEIRAFDQSGKLWRGWQPYPCSPENPDSFTPEQVPSTHRDKMYYGVALREEKGDRKGIGGKENCAAGPVLYAELDLKDAEHTELLGAAAQGMSAEERAELLLGLSAGALAEIKARLLAWALARCDELRLPLRMAVDSGHGLHLYWARQFSSSNEDTERYLKALVEPMRADSKSAELARVLRPPGTFNTKNPERPLPVGVVYLDPAAFVERDALEALVKPEPVRAAAPSPTVNSNSKPTSDEKWAERAAKRRRAEIAAAVSGEAGIMASTTKGGRNNQLNISAMKLARFLPHGELDEGELVEALSSAARAAGLEEGRIMPTIRSGISKGTQDPADPERFDQEEREKAERPKRGNKALELAREKVQKAPAKAAGPSYNMPIFPKGVEEGTDAANALILAGNHLGERLRYTFGVGWYVYDQRRGIWREDDGSLTLSSQVAGEVLRAVVADHVAALVKGRAKDEELNPAITWARNVGSNWAIANALKAAAGRPEFLTDVADWDARPDLLNCRNGVLELTSGTLRPHAPSDLLTWQAGAAFDPTAQHDYVDQLTELLKRDGRHDFLQRLVGSALYGEAPNEVAILLEGEGMTGKGTLVSATVAMLGDYATTINVELLLSNSHGESSTGPKPELLNLRGKRLAVAGEPPKGARFNSGRVKGMTGNDPITARAMRSNILVEFKPVFKLWIHTNYPINTAHDDTGMQRRLRVVPFKAKPERPYAAFKSTLENDARARAALLNWAYQGFRLWHTSGFELGMSAEIEAATGSYWKDQNPYEKFAAACLIFSENAEIQSGRLKTLFEEWAEENGAKMGRAVKMADLYTYLQTFGCEPRRTKSGRFWDGVTEVTEVTPQPQLTEDIHTRERLNRG